MNETWYSMGKKDAWKFQSQFGWIFYKVLTTKYLQLIEIEISI